MHRNQNSFESTPQTVHSSNLSSVMEPNPVIRRLDEHFADLEQGNDAMQQLMEEGVYVPNERTPDKMTSADVASQAGSERDAVQHESDKEDKSVKHVLMQAEEKEDAGSGHGDKIDQQAAAEEVRIDGAKDGGALVRRRSKSREHSRKISDSDAASIIQRNWVNQNYKKKNSKKHADVDKDNVSIKSFRSLERRGEVVDLNLPEDQLLYAHLTRASYVFESPMEKFLQSTSEDVKITAANEDLDLKEPWIPPSIEFAKNNAGRVHPRMLTQGHGQYPILGTSTGRHCVYKGWGEQCDLFHEGSFSSFGVYGPGITNYFKFIKFCFWTFVSLSVLYMPAFLFAVNGDGGLNELAATTLGNVVPYNHTDYTYVPECPRSALLLCEIKMENVGLMWELLDLLACVVVLVGFVWLRFFEKAETAHLNRCGVSPADYTVLVSNLPPSCTEADLRVYFAVLMNEAVSDIVFIYDDEDDIETFKRRGALVKKRYHLTQQYRYHHGFLSRDRKPPHQAPQKTIPEDTGMKDFMEGKLTRKGLLIYLSQERTEVTKAIKNLDRRSKRASATSSTNTLNQAYVTFHAHAAKNNAIKKHKVTLMNTIRPDPNIIFKGHRLYVSPAPDPEKIIWENIKFGEINRLGRQCVTFWGGCILVVVCVIMVSITLGYDIEALNLGGIDLCPVGFESWSDIAQNVYVDRHPETLHCYCDASSSRAAQMDGCKNYYQALTVARLFRAATAVCCCFSAVFIDIILAAMLPFEKHIATDSQEKSRMWRSLLFKVVFYGIVFLFTIGYFGNDFEHNEPNYATYFSRAWYDTTGQALILTMLLNIVTPHAYQLYKYVKYILGQKAVEAQRVLIFTQDEMNSRYVGPEFVLSHRYSQLVATFTVLFMYMGSFPIFAFIGVANFYVTYWLDKFLFVRYYQTPTRYPATVGLQATAMIPYAVIAHLILSLWAVSRSDVFETSQSETTYGSKLYYSIALYNVDPGGLKKLVSQKHTVYMAMLLMLVIIAMIVKWIVHHFLFAGSRITQLLCFDFVSKYDFFFSTKLFTKKKLTMSYPRAVRRGFINGLDNYNILQNQRYKDAFHIDEDFAAQHRRVRSLLASADRPKQSGAPKPLPADDVIANRAIAMFNLNNDEPPLNTPRDRRPSKQNQPISGLPGKVKSGGVTPRDRQGLTPREEVAGSLTPRDRNGLTPRDGTQGGDAKPPRSGHNRVHKMQSYDAVTMEYGKNKNVPFHVVKGEKESRLVSDSYNIRIKQDIVKDTNVKNPHKISDDLSDLSSSDAGYGSEVNNESPDKPEAYAVLSMKMLQARAEPEDVVQARVLKRFESESQYEAKHSYKLKPNMPKKTKLKEDDIPPRRRDDADTTAGIFNVEPKHLEVGIERKLMREASEELLSAPTQKRTANVPRLGEYNSSLHYSSSEGLTASKAVDITVDTLTVEQDVAAKDKRGGINQAKSIEDWYADTPRAVKGTPRDGNADALKDIVANESDLRTIVRASDMPPPNKVIRGGKRKSSAAEIDKSSEAITATDVVNAAEIEAHLVVENSSVRNIQRVMEMGAPTADILKPKNTLHARRSSKNSLNGGEETQTTPIREHRRDRSDLSDPSKRFVPKSLHSFGDKSVASVQERKKVSGEDNGDDDSLRSLSPVHISLVKLVDAPPAASKSYQAHLRNLIADEISADNSDENPTTPRIRAVNGTSSMMSQSAPNSTDPKFQVHSDSFQRGKIEDGVAYARGSDW